MKVGVLIWLLALCTLLTSTRVTFAAEERGIWSDYRNYGETIGANKWLGFSDWQCVIPSTYPYFQGSMEPWSIAPYARPTSTPLGYDQRLVLFGRLWEDGFESVTWIYSFASNSWWKPMAIRLQPEPRHDAAIVTVCMSAVLLIGGKNNAEQSLNDMWHFDSESEAWSQPILRVAGNGQFDFMHTDSVFQAIADPNNNCTCNQSVIQIPVHADDLNADPEKDLWILRCVQEAEQYEWQRIKVHMEFTVTPYFRGTVVAVAEEGFIFSLSNSGLWQYTRPTNQWEWITDLTKYLKIEGFTDILAFYLRQAALYVAFDLQRPAVSVYSFEKGQWTYELVKRSYPFPILYTRSIIRFQSRFFVHAPSVLCSQDLWELQPYRDGYCRSEWDWIPFPVPDCLVEATRPALLLLAVCSFLQRETMKIR